MISRVGALGVKRLLPVAVLLVAALSVAIGLSLAMADNRVVEIVLAPNTTKPAPITLAQGNTQAFAARVITHGEGISTVTLSLMFNPNFLEVVDANPGLDGIQIAPAFGSPLGSPIGGVEVGNTDKRVDNATGRIHATFSTFSQTLPNTDFDVGIINFRAKNGPPSPGDPTMVKFVVDSTTWDDTGAGRGGTPFLKNDSDFPGAWIRIIKPGLVEIFLDPAGTKVIPIEMVPNDIGEFIVKMDTHGEGVTAFTVSIRFNPQFLEVLDSNSALPGVQVQPDPTSPFQGFELENSVNNQTGVIRYTNGSASPRQGVINLVRIKFKAGTTTTPADDPAMVIFKVDSSPANSQTAAGRVGLRLLKNLDDYVGAWIRVGALETTARISAPDTSNEAQQVTFDGSASTAVPGAAIVAYEWDFNDGTPKVTGADKATVTHTFADNGAAPYNVTLKVTDNATPTAGTDTATHKIDVKNLAPSSPALPQSPTYSPPEAAPASSPSTPPTRREPTTR